MPTVQNKREIFPTTRVTLDGLDVVVSGTASTDIISDALTRVWGTFRKRPTVQKGFRHLQERLEGTSLTPGMVFLESPVIPKSIKGFLDAQEHSGSPIVYVVHHGSVNAPDIRSRIKGENVDFYVKSRKGYSLDDFQNALTLMIGLGETLEIPADDDRIPDDVAARISGLNLEDPKTGRLDAVKIAECYGIAPSAFAAIAGVSRQSLLKTPGSPHRQQLFRPFAKLARLGMELLGTGERFRAWLNEPNEELYQHATPLDLIRRGQMADALALVEDQLLGTPA